MASRAWNEARVVLVTGATGKQGGAVARRLLEREGFAVRALTRDPSKSEARALDAAGAEVRPFVYSSVGSADRDTGIPHFDSK